MSTLYEDAFRKGFEIGLTVEGATREDAADVVGLSENGMRIFHDTLEVALRNDIERQIEEARAHFGVGYRNGVLEAYLRANAQAITSKP